MVVFRFTACLLNHSPFVKYLDILLRPEPWTYDRLGLSYFWILPHSGFDQSTVRSIVIRLELDE